MTQSLIRTSVREVAPYSTTSAPGVVDLSDNTNLWGTAPCALDAVRSLDSSAITRYPTIPPDGLVRAIAEYAGVSSDMIVPGCGSDDLIDCAMRAFAEPGDTIAFVTPTFSMVPAYAATNGLRMHVVPYSSDFNVDVDALLFPRPRLVYLCAPNNPTGTMLSPATVERVVREAPGIVILDEAYGEFASAAGFSLVTRHERLVVTRTFSKAFGLAGLRIGYAVLAPALSRALEAVRGPYKVNAAAAAAATAAITDGLSWMQTHADDVARNRDRMRALLASIGLHALPSAANFLCVPCHDSSNAAARVRARGFALRALNDLPPICDSLVRSSGSALRIAVGPWPLMEQVSAALQTEGITCE